MLTPEQLDSYPDALVELWSRTEQSIIADMAERINGFDLFIPSAQWQYEKLKEMGMLEEEIIKALAAQSQRSQKELKALFTKAGVQTLAFDDKIYQKAGLTPIALQDSPTLQRILAAGLERTNGLFKNLANSAAAAGSRQFERALDLAYLQTSTGAFSPTEAIKNAIKELSKGGLEAVVYESGRVDHLDVAVRRAVLTGLNQTSAQLQLARADEMGCDLVAVTAHAGARPSHAVWQGGIYSRSGKNDRYEEFETATGYGTGAGLCGWNCKHSFYPFFEGISKPIYTKKDLASFEAKTITYNGQKMTKYEATQKQRYIERQIRRWKREEAAMQAAGLSTEEAKAKIAKWIALQKDFLKQTELKRQYDREWVGKAAKRITGASSGAIKDPMRQWKHAERYYEEIRKRTDDVDKIAKATGWSKKSIQEIKNHMFINEYLLNGEMQRFAPEYNQAVAWQRLAEGKRIQESDYVLLRHEYLELTLMHKKGYTYDEAHNIANQYHFWAVLIKEGE